MPSSCTTRLFAFVLEANMKGVDRGGGKIEHGPQLRHSQISRKSFEHDYFTVFEDINELSRPREAMYGGFQDRGREGCAAVTSSDAGMNAYIHLALVRAGCILPGRRTNSGNNLGHLLRMNCTQGVLHQGRS